MRKKRKRQSARRSIDTLAVQAKSHLAAGRFPEAMAQYKQLLKQEQRPEWRQALGDAYLGRAEQLAAKGLQKEAAALWENMASLCGRRHVERYIDWLLQAERVGKGLRLFAEADANFRESPAGQMVASRLAGLLVCDKVENTEVLSGNIPLLQQCDTMLTAMLAYCRGDDAAMKDSLKGIPFRSPYRDLCSILRAMGSLGTERQVALAQLDRVPSNSPFAPFVEVVRVACLEDDMLLEALSKRREVEREFILTLKGWGREQIDLVRRLPNATQSSAKVLLRVALGASTQSATSRLRQFCLELLPQVPESLAAFEKCFGSLSTFERKRIQALAAESGRDPSSANVYWRGCVEQLTSRNVGEDAGLKAALILRHMADLAVASPDYGFSEGSEQEREQLLDRSLKLDPQDKPTYLKLMAIARKGGDSHAEGRWAELAVRQFPEDAEVLMVAGLGAYRRGAFKKAAVFAGTLLERDPINSHARNLLISCHLAHARKQLKGGKYAAAESELAIAEHHACDEDHRGIVKLNQGFLGLAQGSEQAAETFLQQGLAALGGGLLAQFRFLVDGRRLGFAHRALTKHYDRVKGRRVPTTVKDMLTLAELLHRYVDDGVKEVPQILERLRAPLKAAAGLAFSEQEFRAILAALKKAGHYRLLADYADAALRRFGQHPSFFFYRVFGRTQGREERMSMVEGVQLQSAFRAAVEAEDRETAALIQEFLGLPGFLSGGIPPVPPDVKKAFEELMDLLDTDDPRDILDLIAEQLQEEGELPSIPLPKRRSS
jgi:tetratricopeptide (TPR) repeat protein